MKLGMINSAWEQHGVELVDGLRRTKAIGFDSVDIFEDPIDAGADARVALIGRTCRDLGLPIISVVGVSVGLIDFNPSVRKFHLERSRAYLDMGAALGARNYLLVIGEYIWQKEVIPPGAQWQWAVESLKVLGDHAAAKGLEIVLELEPFHLSLLNTLGEMCRFLDDVGHPNVKANVDISHMLLSNTKPEEISSLRGRAGHVHISDCDGKKHGDLPPGRGVVPFAGYLEALRKIGFDGAVSVELEYAPDPSRIDEWVKEAYAATAKLLREAGVRP
ncbi:MAG TPA: sugar phosphate isomerase/epimerase [Planctomycetota bacterium]|nr:sugar phosphate isomerase/epimerase [Planctomycetota bacterium]